MNGSTIQLTHSSGAVAEILPAVGFNCYRLALSDGSSLVELLYAEEGFAGGGLRASGSGTPILFPFPGRIRGTTFHWEGRSYELEAGDGRGNAIHGFVHTRPWRVIERAESRAVGQFQASVDDAELLKLWPADFRVTLGYQLEADRLAVDILLENPDARPLPCGLGLHPYFNSSLGGPAEQTLVRLPASARWKLEEMLVTGEREPLGESLAAGSAFGEMQLDDVLTDLRFQGDRCVAEVVDRAANRALEIEFDRMFREMVVYTPPHRRAVCIEPYTCAPDPFRLAAAGADGGLRVLEPGESWRGSCQFRLTRATA